ncbi:cytochrome b/b6 domain-containing protein [Sphingomonas sp.]|uniref:cytochrome b/b6 domain-containing protein n=1 Tax=Sphingomonas sp. TaxID=28214 RepID=UPI000DB316D8|nr:cytochrome b/b6 domain-containing protein [Sphingomonas sp.]PZU09144.1 MAG: Ni/Fe-hydrogenase 1 b-type cytochrome subunit [Sphingomonas sp.]
MSDGSGAGLRVRLWDWPVRICHWAFVILLPLQWWTFKKGAMDWHMRLGLVLLALVAFRILWGFIGPDTARFTRFVKGPGAILAYARGKAGPAVGHNPVGALSVIALLGLLAAQVCVGLVTQDVDGLESGPLAIWVSYETADKARHWHGLIFNLLLGFVALHILAVLFYLVVKRDNLIAPMVTGYRRFTGAVRQPRFAPLWRLSLAILLAAALAWWVSKGAPIPGVKPPPPSDPFAFAMPDLRRA